MFHFSWSLSLVQPSAIMQHREGEFWIKNIQNIVVYHIKLKNLVLICLRTLRYLSLIVWSHASSVEDNYNFILTK